MSNAPTHCTVGPSAVTGKRCGAPAVVTFIGSDGQHYAECPDHAAIPLVDTREQVGQPRTIRRHGKDYVGEIVKITPMAMMVRYTAANGKVKTVREPF